MNIFRNLFDCLVGSSGLEPPTSRLSGARSNHLSYEPIFPWFALRFSLVPYGGDDGIRTHDPLLAGQVLSQLSYTPGCISLKFLFDPSKSNNKSKYSVYLARVFSTKNYALANSLASTVSIERR